MKPYLLFFLLFVAGCTSFPSLPGLGKNPDDQTGNVPSFRCDDFAPARGVIARFSPEATQDVIHEGEPFSLALQFANHHKDPLIVDLTLTDDSATPGFDTVTRSVTVEGATFTPAFQAGCRVLEQQSIPLLPLGDYAYRSVLYDHDLTFLGTLAYSNYISETTFPLCVFNPLIGAGQRCSPQESIAGRSLGTAAQYDPVAITSLKKKLVGSQDTVKVILDIRIENLGQGYTRGTPQMVTFHIESFEGVDFACISDTTVSSLGGDTLDLYLIDEAADVTCHALLTPDRTETYTLTTELTYDYEYPFTSKPVKLLKQKPELTDFSS